MEIVRRQWQKQIKIGRLATLDTSGLEIARAPVAAAVDIASRRSPSGSLKSGDGHPAPRGLKKDGKLSPINANAKKCHSFHHFIVRHPDIMMSAFILQSIRIF